MLTSGSLQGDATRLTAMLADGPSARDNAELPTVVARSAAGQTAWAAAFVTGPIAARLGFTPAYTPRALWMNLDLDATGAAIAELGLRMASTEAAQRVLALADVEGFSARMPSPDLRGIVAATTVTSSDVNVVVRNRVTGAQLELLIDLGLRELQRTDAGESAGPIMGNEVGPEPSGQPINEP